MRFFPLILALLAAPSAHATRAKDIGAFAGVRDVQLEGYGIVTGLQQTGDTQINRATPQMILQELRANGLVVDDRDLLTRNAAIVRLTASMDSDARIGTRVDVLVSSIGDARSLEGGVLETALLRLPGDPQIDRFFVVAQGPLTVGGYNVQADGNQSRRNVTNVGVLREGGVVERELPSAYDYDKLDKIDFLLDADHKGFTNADRLSTAINDTLGGEHAKPVSAAAVEITIPDKYKGSFARFAAVIEQVDMAPDATGRVVLNARTGTVVIDGEVTVRPFAIAHGGLKIEIGVDRAASQPAPFSRNGETVIVENTFIGADEQKGELVLVNAVSLADLIDALNSMGVTPRDLVVILQMIKRAGALDAELVLE